jgi:hypothetical protein
MPKLSRTRYPNIDYLPIAGVFHGSLEDHPFADALSDWFTDHGLLAEPSVTNSNFVSWSHYDGEEKLAYHLGLHRDGTQIYVSATVVFALLPLDQSHQTATRLLRENGWLIAPVKYCVLLADHCSVKFDSHIHLISEGQLRYRLNHLVELATNSRDHFTTKEFGLVALPDSWFKPQTVG